MNILNIIVIAVALAMDAFAVSIAVGMKLKTINPRQIFRLSWHFGLFQAMMPVLGWWAGRSVFTIIKDYDHWIAFGLLFFVGGNMLREAFTLDDDESSSLTNDPTKGLSLVVLSVATSIDALAVGFSISMLNVPIVVPAMIIGLIAGVLTIIGMHLGRTLGAIPRISTWAEALGGIVLWCIGFNVLYEHGVFSPWIT